MPLELSTLNGTNGFKLLGELAGDQNGFSVSGGGDFNGDGIDDIIVASNLAAPNGSASGSTYVVYGKSTGFAAAIELSSLNGMTGFQMSGPAAGYNSGYDAASAGDVNGDGVDDIIIGANGADPNGAASGAAYVVFGRTAGFNPNFQLSALNGTLGFAINGASAGDHLGGTVSAAGDINGDGVGDIIVGAKDRSGPGGAYSGVSYVIFGSTAGFSPSLDVTALNGSNGFKVNGVAAYDSSGSSVSNAGDFNGDGVDDLLIGAAGVVTIGGAYVVYGRTQGFAANINLSALNASIGFEIRGISAFDAAGYSVAAAGDINGDGLDDIVVGALGASPNGTSSAGSAYVVFGRAGGYGTRLDLSSLNGANGFAINGALDGDENGVSVSAAGDVNNDGVDDLIVGAFFADVNGVSDVGAAYVIFGNSDGFGAAINLSSLDYTSGFALNGEAEFDEAGASVSAAGDVNNDGIDDLIVGAIGADPAGRGEAGASYVVFGGAYIAAITGGGAGETLNGTAFGDYLVGFGGNDTLNGQDGGDLLNGGAGADRLDGGLGADTATYAEATAAVAIQLALGTGARDIAQGDTLISVENVIGSAFNDTLIGSNGIGNVLRGADGNDSLNGASGNDTLYGGNGVDRLYGGVGADRIDGGAGVDAAYYATATAAISVNLGTGVGAFDIAQGDFLVRVENVVGSNFNDTLIGANGIGNALYGGIGDDYLNGASGNDRLFAGAGADRLVGGAGADYIDGDLGVDAAYYTTAAAAVSINLAAGLGALDIAQGDRLVGVENVVGSAFNDTMIGADAIDNTLTGGAGDDSLNGGSGNDRVSGDAGNDRLIGGAGADVIDGGTETDTAYYSSAAAAVTINLAAGTGVGDIAQGDTFIGVENIVASQFSDIITGSNLIANGLSGASGADYLNGLSGNDTLNGGNDNDTLIGGSGNDSLIGGAGADQFYFAPGFGADRVADFVAGVGAGDVVRLVGLGTAFDTFAEILAASTQVGADTVINFGGGNTITLVGVLKANLAADDFLYS